MTKFIHEPLEFQKLKRITVDGKRQYETPTGESYPSITTILNDDKPKKEAIAKWTARVGIEEAKKIKKKSAIRGTSLHKQIEDYLIKGEIDRSDPFSLFPSVRPIIDKNVTKIFNIEEAVYSHVLKAAGTFDCYCEWLGKPTLVDWKSAKSVRKPEWVRTYFYQASFYSMCIGEMMGKKYMPKQIVIVVGIDHEIPQVFIKSTSDYIKEVCKSIDVYHKEHK